MADTRIDTAAPARMLCRDAGRTLSRRRSRDRQSRTVSCLARRRAPDRNPGHPPVNIRPVRLGRPVLEVAAKGSNGAKSVDYGLADQSQPCTESGPCAGRDTGGKLPDPANRPWSRQAARKFIAAGLTEPPYRFERSTAAASSSGVTKWHVRRLVNRSLSSIDIRVTYSGNDV